MTLTGLTHHVIHHYGDAPRPDSHFLSLIVSDSDSPSIPCPLPETQDEREPGPPLPFPPPASAQDLQVAFATHQALDGDASVSGLRP